MTADREAGPADSRDKFSRAIAGDSVIRLRKAKEPPSGGAGDARGSVPLEKVGRAGLIGVKGVLHERLLKELGATNLSTLSEDALAQAAREFVSRVLETEDLPLNEVERARLADELAEEVLGVGPLTSLLADPAVTDVLVNRFDQVYVERFGKLQLTEVRFRDDEHLLRVIERIAARVGRRIDLAAPTLDARLKDGSRVNATIPPISLDGATLSIRRFGVSRLRREDLVRLGSLSADMTTFLQLAVRARKNILISGGTGAGKSTLLGAVCEAIPDDERVVTIEDPAELILDQRHVVRFETRPANIEGRGRVATRDLVINSLRMRPDRIIVGEVRGAEALDMLQAMNTGHDGSLSTIHSNSPRDALSRLETMVLMAGLDLPSRAIREQIVSALDFVVHVRRFEDGVRRVEAISEVSGLEGTTPLLQEIFRFQRKGKKGTQVLGEFSGTGIVPRLVEELTAQGIAVPMALFAKRAANA